MEDFLNEIGITANLQKTDNNTYTMDIPNSNAYGKIYSKLDNSDLVEEDIESSQITYDNSSIQFTSDDYLITLLADFNEDTYKLTIKTLEN